MSLLLYCICETVTNPRRPFPPGVAGQPIGLVHCKGLCAVVSRLAAPLHETASDILAFESVVETFHRERSVLPARYGTVLEDETRATEMLGRCREACLSALQELSECVEMGIRIMPENEGEQEPPADVASSGAGYLRSRERYYAKREGDGEKVLDDVRGAFEGLFVKCKVGSAPVTNPPILSLEFLVKRRSEKAFRKRFQALSGRRPERMLFSGPWPPWSFVPTSLGR